MTDAEGLLALGVTEDEVRGFLAGCADQHDRDPIEWHRRMLEPPVVRTPNCRFCGFQLYAVATPSITSDQAALSAISSSQDE